MARAGKEVASVLDMPFSDGANLSEDGVTAGPCTHALFAPTWHADPCL